MAHQVLLSAIQRQFRKLARLLIGLPFLAIRFEELAGQDPPPYEGFLNTVSFGQEYDARFRFLENRNLAFQIFSEGWEALGEEDWYAAKSAWSRLAALKFMAESIVLSNNLALANFRLANSVVSNSELLSEAIKQITFAYNTFQEHGKCFGDLVDEVFDIIEKNHSGICS